MSKSVFLFCLIAGVLSACIKGQKVDLIVHNATIHSMDDKLTTHEAMAIRDGKIIELGPERQILNKYTAKNVINAQGRDVYPGFTDAHIHLKLAAKQRSGMDLSNIKSLQQMITELEIDQQRFQREIIVGQGWNEANWRVSEIPTNELLNQHFPSTPVCLFRYDGHTALVNNAMFQLVGFTTDTQIEGGSIEIKNGQLTGIVTDNAMELVKKHLPKLSPDELKEKIIEIQNEMFMYGITNVHDAGMDYEDIYFYRSLINEGKLKLNFYGMLLPTEENIQFAKKKGIYKHKNLTISSFKVFIDGALGSRGAWLNAPYSDAHNYHGHTTTSKEELEKLVDLALKLNYQLNTHAIGDAAVKMVLDAYQHVHTIAPDHRWRIEHAQTIDFEDLPKFSNYGILPSIQPYHAVNDYLFAEKRLGKERIQLAYAYKSLLNHSGYVAIGSDYPIVDFNPFKTIYAACARKNEKEMPENGFNTHEALTLEECLQGMTVGASLASFQEDHLGRLEEGMDATFAIFDRKITVGMTFQQNFALHTFINGVEVYRAE